MATDYTSPNTGVLQREAAVGSITRSCTIDCNENNIDVSVTGALECVSIPAGAYVNWVALEVVTAEVDASNTVVLDVGDGSDADGWLIDVDAETAGTVAISRTITLTEGTPNVVTPAFGIAGKYYASADTIDVTPSHDLDDCKFTVTVNYSVI